MAQQNTTPGSICAEEYTVKRGDSFYLIAHKLGVPLRDLLAANSDIHPARLMVGDVLCIPREEDDSAGGLGSGSGTNGTVSGSTGNGTGGINGTNGSTSNGTNGATGNGMSGSNGTNGSAGSGTNGSTGNGMSGTNGTGGSVGNGTNGSTSGSTGNGMSGSTGNGTNGSTSNGTNGSTSNGGANGSTGNGTNGTTGSGTNGTGGSTGNGTTTTPGVNCPLDEQLIVQRGQTVADIQLLNLVSRNTLDCANPDVDLDSLRVGQTICVPKENIPCALPNTYTLGVSETLEAVAVQFNLPVASILRANPCLAPQDFEEGVTVVIPRQS